MWRTFQLFKRKHKKYSYPTIIDEYKGHRSEKHRWSVQKYNIYERKVGFNSSYRYGVVCFCLSVYDLLFLLIFCVFLHSFSRAMILVGYAGCTLLKIDSNMFWYPAIWNRKKYSYQPLHVLYLKTITEASKWLDCPMQCFSCCKYKNNRLSHL